MSEKDADLCAELDKIEKAYRSALVSTWRTRPREFNVVVREFEAFLDLKDKLCPK